MPRVRKHWIVDDAGQIRGKLDQILGCIEEAKTGWKVTVKASAPLRDRVFETRAEALAYVAGLEAVQL